MSSQSRIVIYLVAVHCVWAGVAILLLLQQRVWLLAVEAFFLVSIAVGIWLTRRLFVPLQLIRTGSDLIMERDFSCKFIETGNAESDRLIRVYNRMIDVLREERLKLSEQEFFLRELIDASPAGILVLDHDRRIAELNPAAKRLMSLGEAELTGGTLAELPEPFGSGLSGLELNGSRILELRGPRRYKCEKSEFYERGFPRHFILIEELTEELRQSEKAAYGKLVRLMSHEVNNSIGAIGSLLDSCRAYAGQIEPADRDDFLTALSVAEGRAGRLNAFMKRFAEVVRLPPPELRRCDLMGLLKDLALLLEPEFERRGITLVWDVAELPGMILLDKNQMEQVFLNILKNGMESIGVDGTIAIRLRRDVDGCLVAFEDDGPGIPEDISRQLFTPFFTTKPEGQGIGLTLIREVLEQHQFPFSLKSEPGGPTRFTIRLS